MIRATLHAGELGEGHVGHKLGFPNHAWPALSGEIATVHHGTGYLMVTLAGDPFLWLIGSDEEVSVWAA